MHNVAKSIQFKIISNSFPKEIPISFCSQILLLLNIHTFKSTSSATCLSQLSKSVVFVMTRLHIFLSFFFCARAYLPVYICLSTLALYSLFFAYRHYHCIYLSNFWRFSFLHVLECELIKRTRCPCPKYSRMIWRRFKHW